MLTAIILTLASLTRVHCILSAGKPSAISDKNDLKTGDTAVAQSIDRDYVTGFEEGYGHGGYGLTAHANYGHGHEGYAVIEGHKHHIHHTEDYHHHHYDHHNKHYDYAHHKALAIKSLLVPLAGVALLGAAAAFVSNPILLQLGVISGSSLGRRKRSADSTMSPEDRIQLREIKLLERFIAQIPQQDIEMEEKKLLANYLSCSGAMSTTSPCLERVVCELHSPEGSSMPMEANVLSIVVNGIFENHFVPEETKLRISRAAERGKKKLSCGVYICRQLEQRQE